MQDTKEVHNGFGLINKNKSVFVRISKALLSKLEMTGTMGPAWTEDQFSR